MESNVIWEVEVACDAHPIFGIEVSRGGGVGLEDFPEARAEDIVNHFFFPWAPTKYSCLDDTHNDNAAGEMHACPRIRVQCDGAAALWDVSEKLTN